MTNRVLLCIMDGWGISTGSEKYDATKLAHPVNVPKLEKEEKTNFIFRVTERRHFTIILKLNSYFCRTF